MTEGYESASGRTAPSRGLSGAPTQKADIWLDRANAVTFALQPIVHAATGVVFGVEALLRGYAPLGFPNPHAFFDAAFADDALFLVDIRLREKAIAKFKELPFHDKLILFYNYDPRILEMPDYRPGMTERLMTNFDLVSDQICFEINEKYPIDSQAVLGQFVRNMKERGIKIALDDFGSGFAGLELFYHADPGVLKFDRFLVSRIETDVRKRNICSHLVALCRMQGIVTVAEGVETEAEAMFCRELGFDLLQGYFIASPTTDLRQIKSAYESVRATPRTHRRHSDAELIRREILPIETIGVDDDMRVLLDNFHNRQSYNFFPVLDANRVPLGIVHEKTIKEYIYSPFGRELLSNRSVTRGLRSFITPCPVADIHTPQDKILENFMAAPESEGVIIVQNAAYFGFLNAKSLLNLLHEKNLNEARDMNPLTRLPGNNVVYAFLGDAIAKCDEYSYLVYFDFDHFKPFNDRFGFRLGDRAILIFANILRRLAPPGGLVAHIGGDDFFWGSPARVPSLAGVLRLVAEMQQTFTDEVRPFFSPLERAQGFYISHDRENQMKEFPLLGMSAAVLELLPGQKPARGEDIAADLAVLKKEAKAHPDRLVSIAYKS